jgi:serine/threonine protein kinase
LHLLPVWIVFFPMLLPPLHLADDSNGSDRIGWESGLLEAALTTSHSPHPIGAHRPPEVAGFECIGWLGSGASGEVWLADELEADRTVALKIMHRSGMSGASDELFQREFRLLAKMQHPNLVLLHRGVVTSDGRHGLAMEWIDGWPLDEWLASHPDLSLSKQLLLFRDIVAGAAYLHDHGVIHRDLKPANVIVDAHGVAKIVDFGLARLHQEDSASGLDGGSIGVSGTLHFMAPEQAANGRGSRAMPVDVYALGLMLHRILTGSWLRLPEGTPAETLAQVLNPPPLVLNERGRALPRDLQSILRQALAPDPSHRYHHARELEADLIRFANKQPVAARKHTFIYLTTTFLRRQARRSALAGALVLAGLIAGGILYQRHRAVALRNEKNLKYAYTLTSFTLRQLRDELRTSSAAEVDESEPDNNDLPEATVSTAPALPVDAAGELDLRYYQAMLADLRSATSEGQSRHIPALRSIRSALDLFSKLAQESPDDPKRLLDAAQARLSFARLLGRVGRADEAGEHARKTLIQVDRLAAWPGFDATPLLSLRCDALRLLAQQSHHAGDSSEAMRLCKEMLAACEAFPSGLLLRPENETLPRMAVAAVDLATYAVEAGPDQLAEARLKIEQITKVCRAAHEKDPRSFPLACGLAHSLHATARICLHDGSSTDLLPIFDEAADLLIRADSGRRRSVLPLVWSISRTATEWAGTLLDHPDLKVSTSALILAQRFTVHLRRSGDERQEVMIQRGQIYLYQSRLAYRKNELDKAIRSSNLALSTLRPRQLSDPDKDSLALLTAEALHHGKSLANLPISKWTSECDQHLESLLTQLSSQAEQLAPAQRRLLASLRSTP